MKNVKSSDKNQSWIQSIWIRCWWVEINTNFKRSGSFAYDLCKDISDFLKHISINKTKFQNYITSLETYIANGLVPLDKNSSL